MLRGVRSSYWFVPAVMLVFSIVLGAVLVWLDSGPASGLLDGLGWYQVSKPAGAREVLSAIASSMITVASVVFSITIVAISYAASQYGPRVLTNFMSDRGNQVTLGTFLATFAYSLVVLRTIYSGDQAFVPQLAVMVGLILALCSMAVLIYFIHHVAQSIHINVITARIGKQLIDAVADRFQASPGEPTARSEEDEQSYARRAERAFSDPSQAAPIACTDAGYLQAIDDDRLLELASCNDLLVRLERSPGEFLFSG